MKTYQITILADTEVENVTKLLSDLAKKGIIEFSEGNVSEKNEPVNATEDLVQEIIDEAEIGPYYSDEEAKKILNL